jgi:hypothetical protein
MHSRKWGRVGVLTTKEYSARLEGVDAHDLSLGVLRDLCDLFLEGSQRCARLVAEGRSVGRGILPSWVKAAADLRVSRFEQRSLDLGMKAPRLIDVAPDLFAQPQLFPAGTDAGASAFDLLLDAAGDAVAGKRDSERLDSGVLEVLGRASSLFSQGGTRLTVERPGHPAVVLDSRTAALIRTLADETPAPRVSRVRGLLDALTISTRLLSLRLDDGRILRGFAGGVELDQLKQLLGTLVVVEGMATFRPSGEALRLEVDSASPASEGDVIWAEPPKSEPVARSRPSQAPVGLDAFFGKWPGDESDESLALALRDLS